MVAKKTRDKKPSEVRAADVLGFIRAQKSALEQEFKEVDAELAKIKARHDRLQKKLGDLGGQEAYWAVENGEEAAPSEVGSISAILPDDHPQVPQLRAKHLVYADVARTVLESEGRPLRTNQIARIMAQKHYFEANEKEWPTGAIYSSMARRKKVFLRTRDGHWGLVGRDEDRS